jgi:hypothetical protein
MMSKRLIALSLGLVLRTLSADAAEDVDLAPEDFAYGRNVEVNQAAPLQSVLLDLLVYRGTVEPSLDDLRVFNGAGEAVPHAIRSLAAPKQVEGERVPVPFFRLPDQPAGERMPRHPDSASDGERTYRIDAEVSDDGTIVRVTSHPAEDGAVASVLPAAYLIDTSQIEQDLVRVELELAQNAVEFVVPLRLEASDDLVHFRPIATRAALVRLEQSGHRIENSDVEIPTGRYRYLRVSWPEVKLPVEILGAHVRLAPENELPARYDAHVAGRRVADESDAFVFDLGGAIPVDRLQIDLPDDNTLVEARLFSAPSEQGPWTSHYAGLLYRLESPRPLRNAEIPWSANRHRYVKLETSSKGGGLGNAAPLLAASWYPEQLLFLTRGSPPFRLAYGRAGAAGGRFDAAQLLGIAHTPRDEVPRATAALGEEYAVAPPSVLVRAEEPISTRTVALWVVLLTSVVVVLGLSVRLARQMRQGS